MAAKRTPGAEFEDLQRPDDWVAVAELRELPPERQAQVKHLKVRVVQLQQLQLELTYLTGAKQWIGHVASCLRDAQALRAARDLSDVRRDVPPLMKRSGIADLFDHGPAWTLPRGEAEQLAADLGRCVEDTGTHGLRTALSLIRVAAGLIRHEIGLVAMEDSPFPEEPFESIWEIVLGRAGFSKTEIALAGSPGKRMSTHARSLRRATYRRQARIRAELEPFVERLRVEIEKEVDSLRRDGGQMGEQAVADAEKVLAPRYLNRIARALMLDRRDPPGPRPKKSQPR